MQHATKSAPGLEKHHNGMGASRKMQGLMRRTSFIWIIIVIKICNETSHLSRYGRLHESLVYDIRP